MISLEDFVSESIQQVIRAVAKSNEAVGESGAIVARASNRRGTDPKGVQQRHTGLTLSEFEFDIAITAMDGTTAKVGIGVVVGALTLGGCPYSTGDGGVLQKGAAGPILDLFELLGAKRPSK